MPNNLLLPGTNNVALTSTNNTTATKKRYSWALVAVVLFMGRAIRVLTSWDTYHFLQSSSTPISIFAGYSLFWASTILCLLQRPWKGKRISKRRFSRVCLLSCIIALALVCWLQGLQLCGVFRVLFFDGVELPLVFIYSLMGSGESLRRQKLRGLVVVGLAYLLLFISPFVSSTLNFQPGSVVESLENVDNQRDPISDEKSTASMLSKLRSFATKPSPSNSQEEEDTSLWSDPNAQKESVRQLFAEEVIQRDKNPTNHILWNISPLGILLVTISSVLFVMYRLLSLKIASNLDGPKRVFAISNSLAVLFLLPICIFQQWFVAYPDAAHPWPSLMIHSCSFALGWIVVPFYVQSFVSSKMGHFGSTELNFASTLVTLIILKVCTSLSWSMIPEIISGILQLVGIHSLLSGRQIKSYDMNPALGGEL
ncbi:hypothetical protein GpartN1_g7751.t1 [Galdieria partita]|uniref:Uncharacterized protein n=1 Tax=Galdieria partita TaxID=83374 RepID=A0A9C7Q5L0_9RHOD|nr:hypothetical protein GpartN1_g7751.t1 [Galdieria partita]